jgi:hypothetical protein
MGDAGTEEVSGAGEARVAAFEGEEAILIEMSLPGFVDGVPRVVVEKR